MAMLRRAAAAVDRIAAELQAGRIELIGRTEAALWDIERPQPALLTPGMLVRFRSAGSP